MSSNLTLSASLRSLRELRLGKPALANAVSEGCRGVALLGEAGLVVIRLARQAHWPRRRFPL